jgi:hypothetical protein
MVIMGQIIADGLGFHNQHLDQTIERLQKSKHYKDQSTICVIPSRGTISARVVQNWFNFMSPMNQKFFKMIVSGMEVGEAYNGAVDIILNNPDLQKWKYMLTLEDDNMIPADGLLRLLEDMEEYDVVGGLYFTKGEGGQPMIYGNPNEMPLNFRPQLPILNTVQRCNGLGMGFTLFKIDIFRDSRITKPFFKTQQEVIPNVGARAFTQDLYFFEKIHSLGYKVACDTRVGVGHLDPISDIIW